MSRTVHHVNQKYSQSTPSWWVRQYMTVPQRAQARLWELQVKQTKVEDLDTLDLPAHGKKPYAYYW